MAKTSSPMDPGADAPAAPALSALAADEEVARCAARREITMAMG